MTTMHITAIDEYTRYDGATMQEIAVTVTGQPMRYYTLTAQDDGEAWTIVRCTCEGFGYSGDCQHRRHVIDTMNQPVAA